MDDFVWKPQGNSHHHSWVLEGRRREWLHQARARHPPEAEMLTAREVGLSDDNAGVNPAQNNSKRFHIERCWYLLITNPTDVEMILNGPCPLVLSWLPRRRYPITGITAVAGVSTR